MNIAVVDDLAVGRETLVNYLNEYFSERNMNVTISDFSDAESFVTQFENNKYNIIFFFPRCWLSPLPFLLSFQAKRNIILRYCTGKLLFLFFLLRFPVNSWFTPFLAPVGESLLYCPPHFLPQLFSCFFVKLMFYDYIICTKEFLIL